MLVSESVCQAQDILMTQPMMYSYLQNHLHLGHWTQILTGNLLLHIQKNWGVLLFGMRTVNLGKPIEEIYKYFVRYTYK